MSAISQTEFKQLSPQQKAQMIYSQARSELSTRLWRAALGGGEDKGTDALAGAENKGIGLDSLLALFDQEAQKAASPATLATAPASATDESPPPPTRDQGGDEPTPFTNSSSSPQAVGLGPNQCHQPSLSSAAQRTGIPAPALAAIVQAEAAKGRDGSWLCYSRNPRSSAAGLGQFLSGTWEGMAESKGTWLNAVAREKGWLNDRGQVHSAARSALLSLRYDANASINTIADYARQNLDGLKRAGVAIEASSEGIARSAYLGHHLGLGDAIRFAKGGLDPSRARMLLGAQIGAAKASAHIASAGDATAAHRSWFLGFVSRNIRPDRFGA